MALPVVVKSGLNESCGPPMKAPNGSVYVPVASGSTVQIFKIVDPDSDSFAEQDGGNRPSAGASTAIDYMHACQYEHLIFTAYGVLNGSEHDIVLKKFDTSTDLWVSGTETIYSGGPGKIPAQWRPCYLVASPQFLYVIHPSDDETVHGTDYDRCMVSSRSLDGTTWTNSSELGNSNQVQYHAHSLAVSESEHAVAIYATNETAGQNSLRAAIWNRSSFGTEIGSNVTAQLPAFAPGQAVSYDDAGTNRIIVRNDQTSAGTYVWRMTASGTTLTAVANTQMTTAEAGARGGLARWGTTLYAWLANTSNNPASSDSSDDGATWSGPTEFSNPSNNVTEHPWVNMYTRKGKLKAAIVYKEGTTQLSYDERDFSNVAAPGWASARTPVRQNRIFVDA